MTDREKDWSFHIDSNGMQAELLIRAEAEVSKEAVETAVLAKGICFGRLGGAVERALAARDTLVLIAKGKPPLPGKDAKLHLHVAETILSGDVISSVGEDLRQQALVPAVEAGTLLAEIIPPSAGEPGMNIFGKEVAPPSPRALTLRALQGTALSADGTKITASITGRPHMEKAHSYVVFTVQPDFTHRGDVTVKLGILSFKGNITIFGNIPEETAVAAMGDITVHGNVVGARLDAGKHITISGNVIQGKLTAGKQRLIANQALPQLLELLELLEEFTHTLRQISAKSQLAKVPLTQIANHIAQARYPRLPERLAALQKILHPEQSGAENCSPVGELLYKELSHSLQVKNWQDWDSAANAIKVLVNLRQVLENAATYSGDIKAAYVHNSTLHAGSNILVRGLGCMYSKLEAGEDVQIHGRLRSSKVVAQNHIYAREVGSEAGASAMLHVSAKGRIETDCCYENAVLFVGKNMLKVTETMRRCKTAFDENERLILIHRH